MLGASAQRPARRRVVAEHVLSISSSPPQPSPRRLFVRIPAFEVSGSASQAAPRDATRKGPRKAEGERVVGAGRRRRHDRWGGGGLATSLRPAVEVQAVRPSNAMGAPRRAVPATLGNAEAKREVGEEGGGRATGRMYLGVNSRRLMVHCRRPTTERGAYGTLAGAGPSKFGLRRKLALPGGAFGLGVLGG